MRNDRGEVALVHFGFNSWGEKYLPYDDDARLPELLASHFGVRRYRAPFVLEGGSFFVDGEGTLVTTEQCLLHPNRNPSMSREEIEEGLRAFLGVDVVIWLPHGLVEDRDTDGHIDGLAQYVRPGVVMLAVAAGDDDPNAPRFAEDRTTLGAARDATGRTLEVLDGPVNSWADVEGVGPVVIPYMNHYLANGAVIVPIGGGPEDEPALDLLGKAYPDARSSACPARSSRSAAGVRTASRSRCPRGRSSADRAMEAGPLARVAGGALLVHAREEHVAVAVRAELLPVLGVAGRVALAPELLPRAAPVDHPPLGDRAVEGLTVRPREHQDVAVLHVLHDDRDQALCIEDEFVEVDPVPSTASRGCRGTRDGP